MDYPDYLLACPGYAAEFASLPAGPFNPSGLKAKLKTGAERRLFLLSSLRGGMPPGTGKPAGPLAALTDVVCSLLRLACPQPFIVTPLERKASFPPDVGMLKYRNRRRTSLAKLGSVFLEAVYPVVSKSTFPNTSFHLKSMGKTLFHRQFYLL